MKISDGGFDARRLRPRGNGNWRVRIVAAFAALLATLGVLLTLAGVGSLLGHAPPMGDLNATRLGSAIVTAVGLLVLYLGVGLWRRCRRRLRQGRALNMSPHLMKKHD
jgi:hypothetical protein